MSINLYLIKGVMFGFEMVETEELERFIVFEVREDTEFWQSDSAKAKANLPEDRHWEQVPIFVKAVIRKTDASGKEVISTEYISLLSAYNPNSPDGYKGNARKIIYEAYKKGGKVTSTIKNKEFSTGAKGNIINLRTSKGEVVFVNPVGEDGIGYKFVNGVPIQTTPTVAIAVGMETLDEEGNPTEVSRKFELGNTKGLTPEEISKMADSLNTALSFYKELTDAGIAVFVIQDPRGDYRAIPAVTRKLTKVAQKQALAALGKRDLVTFNEIVGTNKVRATTENFLEVESVDKAWGATEEAPGIRVTFYSASAKSLVSVQYDTLLQAITEQEQTGKSELPFSFTVVEQTPEGGKNFAKAARPKEEFGKLKPLIVSDFLSVLANKRFQVDKALLQTNDPYVSKVTGNQYPSYTDYLFSDTEATEPRESGLGSNAILATNVANNNYGSIFFDIGLSFTDIKVDGVGVEIKEEMRAREFEEPVSTPPANTTSVSSGISLSLPPLPGMAPPIQFNPSNAPAPAAAPKITSSSQTIEQGGKTYTVTLENGNGVIRNSKGDIISGNSSIGSAVLDKVNWDTLEEGPQVPATTQATPKSRTTIQMQPNNVAKILSGTKTTTTRSASQAEKIGIPKGGSAIVNFGGQDFIVTNRGAITIQEAGGKDAMLKSEGVKSESEFAYQQTKDWVNGKGTLYVYDIVPLKGTPKPVTTPQVGAIGKVSAARMQEIAEGLDSGNNLIFDFKGDELEAARAYLRKQLETKVAATPASDTTGLTREQLGLEEAPKTIRIKGVMYLASEVNAKMLQGLGITGEEANDILNSICN